MMNRKHYRMTMGFTVVALVLTGASGFAGTEREARVREPQIVVPRDMATIQEAVDAIPDGGRVIVNEGVYEETVTVDGKMVKIVGEGRPQIRGAVPERVVDATEAQGLINYVRGGGGLIQGFNFIGGDAAVKGFDRSAPPGPLVVKDSTIQSSGRGILWGYSKLNVESVFITDTLWHGISGNTLELFMTASSIDHSIFGVGIYIKDAGLFNPVQITSTSTFANHLGGILAINSFVEVEQGVFFDNGIANIRLTGSAMSVKNSIIDGAVPEAGTGKFGDGVVVMPLTVSSTLEMENTAITDSGRAGISNFGSNVALKDILIQCAAFDLADQFIPKDLFGPGLPPQDLSTTYDDQGGNACGCPVADSRCLAVPAGLAPPEPDSSN
jgi:hypothetical protein